LVAFATIIRRYLEGKEDFHHEIKKDTHNREIVCESSSMSSINFFPVENMVPEIKDDYNIVNMQNSALNQNLEGLTKLFVGRGSTPLNYFSFGGRGDAVTITFYQ
jgi:hypothetical protein